MQPAYLPEQIAEVCHEANRHLQIIQADESVPVAPVWQFCTPEMQQSAVEGVRGVLNGDTAEQSHDGWCRFKREHGWIWGPVKDETAKTHPCLIPYVDLPEGQRLKDRLFGAIVRALAGMDA
jgi:hypothetical protein